MPKQVELEKFIKEEPVKPEPVKAKPSDRLSKKSEICEMPHNAQFMQWIDNDESCDVFWAVWFPSGRIPDLLYMIKIDRDDYTMSCNCPAFAGGEDENGRPFAGKGFCSHTRRFRWTCSMKKYDPKCVSLAARLNLSEEWLDEKKISILEAVKRKSMTCDELEIELKLKHQTCSAIINWLHRNGFLEDSGDTRPTRSGERFQAIVWQIP